MWNKSSNFRVELSKSSNFLRFTGFQYFTLSDGNEVIHRGPNISRQHKSIFCAALAGVFLYDLVFTVAYFMRRIKLRSQNENVESEKIVQDMLTIIILISFSLSVIHSYNSSKLDSFFIDITEVDVLVLIERGYRHFDVSGDYGAVLQIATRNRPA